MEWAYGITTVPQRRNDLFPRTLASLQATGFETPRLFVDGAKDDGSYREFGLEVTTRYPTIRAFGNWCLALAELYIRQPHAERYAIFQDDIVTYRNLRRYLESCEFPATGYWNLYTVPRNQSLCPTSETRWFRSNQLGKGALGLVFNHEGVKQLLSNFRMIDRPMDSKRGHRSIDGGVSNTFRSLNWTEYCHNPTLVQHLGQDQYLSTMQTTQRERPHNFQGEDFDALELLCPTLAQAG